MATIQGVYLALFGRPADPAGLAFFISATKNGTDLSAIGNLAGQPEYLARFAGMTNTQIVNSIYKSLFGRDAEKSGLDFFVGQLESGKQTINTIAINILDGALGPDKLIINAKLAAAELFTSHLDLAIEVSAFSGTTALNLVRAYIDTVNTTHAATAAEIDALIQSLLTSGGQGPGDGDPGSSDPGSNNPGPAFAVTVSGTGVLTFSGTSFDAADPVHVHVNAAGNLQFEHDGNTAILTGNQNFKSLQTNVKLVADASLTAETNSQVLAFHDGAWHVAGNGSIDAADFYEALGTASNVLLLDGFDVNEAYAGSWGSVQSDITQGLSQALSHGLPGILNLANWAATYLSSTADVAVVASENAKTSLNAAIESLINEFTEQDVELPSWLPNIGLPILLSGAGAHGISATGETGFTLVGNWDAIKTGLTPPFTVPIDATADTLVGGEAADVFLGLTDNGKWEITGGQIISKDAPYKITVTGGDHLTGGGGNDTFVHLEFKNIYSDGVDTISDFNQGDQMVVVGDKYIFLLKVDADNDGTFDDTLVSFSGTNGFDEKAGIVFLNADVFKQPPLSQNGFEVTLLTTSPLPSLDITT